MDKKSCRNSPQMNADLENGLVLKQSLILFICVYLWSKIVIHYSCQVSSHRKNIILRRPWQREQVIHKFLAHSRLNPKSNL